LELTAKIPIINCFYIDFMEFGVIPHRLVSERSKLSTCFRLIFWHDQWQQLLRSTNPAQPSMRWDSLWPGDEIIGSV
jgi:hypothetical protein